MKKPTKWVKPTSPYTKDKNKELTPPKLSPNGEDKSSGSKVTYQRISEPLFKKPTKRNIKAREKYNLKMSTRNSNKNEGDNEIIENSKNDEEISFVNESKEENNLDLKGESVLINDENTKLEIKGENVNQDNQPSIEYLENGNTSLRSTSEIEIEIQPVGSDLESKDTEDESEGDNLSNQPNKEESEDNQLKTSTIQEEIETSTNIESQQEDNETSTNQEDSETDKDKTLVITPKKVRLSLTDKEGEEENEAEKPKKDFKPVVPKKSQLLNKKVLSNRKHLSMGANNFNKGKETTHKTVVIDRNELHLEIDKEDIKQKRFRKRKNLSMEYLTTERTYVANLVSLIDTFKVPLEKSELIDPNDMRVIFLNTETLIPIHKKLLLDLENRLSKEWDESSCIGDIIKTLVPFMKLYIDYVNGFDEAEHKLRILTKKSEKLKQFIDNCDTVNNNGASVFFSLQICPIQRIPRYVLLLKELKDSTDEEHVDYKDIVSSFHSVSSLAETINKTKQKHEDQAKLRNIATKLKGKMGILHQSFIFNKNIEHNWIGKKTSKKCDYCTEVIGDPNMRKCTVCGILTHEACHKLMPMNCPLEKSLNHIEPSLITPTRKLIKKFKCLHRCIDLERIGDTINAKPKEANVFLMNDSLLITNKEKQNHEVIDLVRWVSHSKNAEIKINETVSKDTFSFSVNNPRIPLSHTFFLDTLDLKTLIISDIRKQIEIYSQQSDSRLSLISSQLNVSKDEVKEEKKEVKKVLRFKIPNSIPVGSSSEKPFTAYMVEVLYGEETTTILKRYNSFLSLHSSMKKSYAEKLLPYFPGKKLVGNMNTKNIQKRCRKLEEYMNNCFLQLEGFLDQPPVVEFLTTSAGTKGENVFNMNACSFLEKIVKGLKNVEEPVKTEPLPNTNNTNNTSHANNNENDTNNENSNHESNGDNSDKVQPISENDKEKD